MVGEENPTAAALKDTSVPVVTKAETATLTPLRISDAALLPYDTATRWRAWPAFGKSVLITLVGLGVAGIVISVGHAVTGRTGVDLADGTIVLAMLMSQAVTALWALKAAGAKGDKLTTVLALKAPAGGFWIYLKALGVMSAVVAIYTVVTTAVFDHDAKADMEFSLKFFRGDWWWAMLIITGIGAPLSEELLFRGFLQTALVPSRLGFWGASLATTTLWTTLHAYSLVGMVQIFIIGLLFALFLQRTGSLRVTLLCHSLYNTAIALMLIFAPKEWLGF